MLVTTIYSIESQFLKASKVRQISNSSVGFICGKFKIFGFTGDNLEINVMK